MTDLSFYWAVELSSEDGGRDLTHLAWVFRTPDMQVFGGPDGFYLSSTRLRSTADADKLREVVGELLGVMNGWSQLVWPGIEPVHAVALHRFSYDGARIEGGMILTVPRIALLVGDDGEGIAEIVLADPGADPLNTRPLPSVAREAFHDLQVQRTLVIYGKGPPSWSELYVVLEIISTDLGGQRAIRNCGWASMNQIDRFMQSANDPRVAGINARHGVSKSPQFPSDPMSIQEARQLIRRILAHWIAYKGRRDPDPPDGYS